MIRDREVIRLASARGQYAPDDVDPTRFFFLFDHAAYEAEGPAGRPAARSVPCAVSVPLPSSPLLKPWLYIEPDDADDYLQQLDDFVEDQVQTGCLLWARQERVNGVRFFRLATYGFERSSSAEHERQLDAAGPSGWYLGGLPAE